MQTLKLKSSLEKQRNSDNDDHKFQSVTSKQSVDPSVIKTACVLSSYLDSLSQVHQCQSLHLTNDQYAILFVRNKFLSHIFAEFKSRSDVTVKGNLKTNLQRIVTKIEANDQLLIDEGVQN